MATGALVEEIAENLEEAAEATRRINTVGVGYFLGGVVVGAAVGFYLGYRYNRQKIYAEAFEQSEIEVEKIREVYQQKTIAGQEKKSVEEIVAERGYSVATDVVERPLPAPVPIIEAPVVAVVENTTSKNDNWDYPKELAKRNPEHPYVIHQDEFSSREMGYAQVTYTYYAADDVLTGEDDKPLPHADITVGRDNLRWGHGSDDEDVVFIRNDRLEIEIELCRSPKSYEEDVLGLEHSHDRGRPRNRRR